MTTGGSPPDETFSVPHVEWELRPRAERPIMLGAFSGWNDAGEAASAAIDYLRDTWNAVRFARIDPEDFYDFQVNRPTVRLDEGLTRAIDWPGCELFRGRSGERDVVLLLGPEPSARWRTFCGAILALADELEVEVLVTLGAFLADVPHTLAAPVSAASADRGWLARPGVTAARYEGPTGIIGVLNDAAAGAGLATVSLWAAAPHYLPTGPNPKVALALLEGVRTLLGLDVDTAGMARAVPAWERDVSAAIQEDVDLAGYVRQLEAAAAGGQGLGSMPSGDVIAAELEEFLRDQDRDEDGEDPQS